MARAASAAPPDDEQQQPDPGAAREPPARQGGAANRRPSLAAEGKDYRPQAGQTDALLTRPRRCKPLGGFRNRQPDRRQWALRAAVHGKFLSAFLRPSQQRKNTPPRTTANSAPAS